MSHECFIFKETEYNKIQNTIQSKCGTSKSFFQLNHHFMFLYSFRELTGYFSVLWLAL